MQLDQEWLCTEESTLNTSVFVYEDGPLMELVRDERLSDQRRIDVDHCGWRREDW